ncbi:MAG: hypothetical protein RL701_5534 [Pseudomonadota bacterium]
MTAQTEPMDALSFELAGSRYALPARYIRELVRAVAIDPLPSAPGVIAGVFNFRGRIVPVIALRLRLGLATKPLSPDDFFIIVDAPLPQRAANDGPSGPTTWQLALLIDRPLDLVSIIPDTLANIAPSLPDSKFILGVVATADGVLLIQDLPAFLSHTEAALLAHALAHASGDSAVHDSESARLSEGRG